MTTKITTRALDVGPAFISADDAARYLHARVGGRRDREFGSVIFQRVADQLFVVNEPVEGEEMIFSFSLLLDFSEFDGRFTELPGYQFFASFHSHPDSVETTLHQNSQLTAQQAKAFVSFFSGGDIEFNHRLYKQFKAAYLSGPDGVLLKYQPSGSVDEAGYADWLLNRGDRTSPHATDGTVEGIFKKLSSVGRLTFLQSSPTWGGSVGQVPADWEVYKPFVSATREQPACTATFNQAQAAVLDALNASPANASVSRSGFLLKHRSRDIYAATLPDATASLAPEDVFPKRPDGKTRLPSQFRLEGIFLSQQDPPTQETKKEPWLARVFFTTAQLIAATEQGQKTIELQVASRGLQLYGLFSDGALLRLKVPATGDITDKNTQADLLAGTLSPRNYIRAVINRTELWVVQAGKLWRDVGPVDRRSALLAATSAVVLSGNFLSSRDAALHAHEQIGEKRGLYYGGYVLKDADCFFVITRPLESLDHPFAGSLFFPAGAQGALIPPESYELHARYGSHTALSMVDPVWVRQRNWSHEDAQINLQVFSDDEMYSIILDKRVAYLSGAEDCLLEYTPNQSPEEQLLLANIGPPAGENRLGRQLDRRQIKPVDWVQRLAKAGDFRIIQGNSLWGPRGVVYSDWAANFEYAPRLSPPDYVTYGAVFASADEAARDLHQRVHGRNLAEQACFAFIFKRRDQDQYIATDTVGVSAGNNLFKLASLFSRAESDGFVLPQGFKLYALFRSQQWSPRDLNAANAWLTLYFAMPDVLFAALDQAQFNRAQGLPVYLSTLDGALLRYLPSATAAKTDSKAAVLAQSQLDTGTKTPLQFVREWAAKGELRVVRTSQCWDVAGRVSETWSGHQTMRPRRLSPAFASPDDAARHALASIGNAFNRAYGGVILKLVNGLYVATEPLVTPPRGVTMNWIFPDAVIAVGLYPGGSTIVARYRSLPVREVPLLLSTTQKALYQTMMPTGALAELLRREVHVSCEYVFGASGSILRYQLTSAEQEALLLSQLVSLSPTKNDLDGNAIEQHLRTGMISPQDFMNQVAKACTLQVVEGDALWGMPRTLKPSFALHQYRPNPLDIRQVSADSPCSPIFTRAIDAVRYVQRVWKPLAQVAVGYVLKAKGKECYMATLPLVRDRFDDFNAVFEGGMLPQGYALDGFFLCASTQRIAAADDEMALSFFAPAAIGKALLFMTTAANGAVLPLHLLCADGALLRYTLPKTAPLGEWVSKAGQDATQLFSGALSVRDYVRRLAMLGELNIQVTSAIWSRKQRVDGQWWPKRPAHALQDDPDFQPFCGPLYFYADDAARHAQRTIGPFDGKRYLGALLMPPGLSGFVAIEPVEHLSGSGNMTLERLFHGGRAGLNVPTTNALHTYKVVAVHAFYRAIASTSSTKPFDTLLLPNFVSNYDLNNYVSVLLSNAPQANSVYLTCRGGGLLKYVPAFSAAETLLLSTKQDASPSAIISSLRRMGWLSVLVTDAFWKKHGLLDETWATDDPESDEPWYGRAKDEL